MLFNIPGRDPLTIETIILDLNGTLSVAGVIPEGVKERLQKLRSADYKIVFFTGNTRNDADELSRELGIEWRLAADATAKKNLAAEFNAETCVSIGNGLIDLELMKTVALRIVTLQAEGVHIQTLLNSDIVMPSINDALDLLIDPQRLIATLRT
ncbi:MAG: haloacid dehalogenase [Candidatus Saccharibacteria bacterium]|nr:haloacid dehalogenase [Candidatus Saccharibacteria bacterium]